VNLLSAMLCMSKNFLLLKLTALADTFALCGKSSIIKPMSIIQIVTGVD